MCVLFPLFFCHTVLYHRFHFPNTVSVSIQYCVPLWNNILTSVSKITFNYAIKYTLHYTCDHSFKSTSTLWAIICPKYWILSCFITWLSITLYFPFHKFISIIMTFVLLPHTAKLRYVVFVYIDVSVSSITWVILVRLSWVKEACCLSKYSFVACY